MMRQEEVAKMLKVEKANFILMSQVLWEVMNHVKNGEVMPG